MTRKWIDQEIEDVPKDIQSTEMFRFRIAKEYPWMRIMVEDQFFYPRSNGVTIT